MPDRIAYTFRHLLGRGGYGEVYLADQRMPGALTRAVAVKLLKADLGQAEVAEAARRLRDEARTLGILDHPAILRVGQLTRLRGRLALVTEYVEGWDLAALDAARLPLKVAVGIVGEVAAALDTAWTTVSPETGRPLRLIHRDVKPENIRLGRHGEVKLLDFGIARTTELVRAAQTVAGDLPVSHRYAAPEVFLRGERDAASDAFSLGATLVRALTGSDLFEGLDLTEQIVLSTSKASMGAFVQDRTEAIGDADTRQLVRQMLSLEPSDRPSHAHVQRRCEAICDALGGPDHTRWARAQPAPSLLDGPLGDLVGEVVEAEPLGSGLDDALAAPPSPGSPAEQGAAVPPTASSVIVEDGEVFLAARATGRAAPGHAVGAGAWMGIGAVVVVVWVASVLIAGLLLLGWRLLG